MQQHLALLQDILDNGHDHPDRTTVGRRSVYERQVRFNMSDGFPLVTTREINTQALVRELLWFIKGNTGIADLGSNIWDRWAVRPEHIIEFIDTKIPLPEVSAQFTEADLQQYKASAASHFSNEFLGSIGPMYGFTWRDAPVSKVSQLAPLIAYDDIPKDKLAVYKDEYATLTKEETMQPQPQELISEEEFCRRRYNGSVDQLNNLYLSLRDRPYSSRHVVSAWVPELIPDETISPQENVLTLRGSLAPCHMSFQCHVVPPAEGERPKLILMVRIRSNDMAIGFPYNVAQYALLLHMLAQVLDMEPYELVYSGGDVHIYQDQIELVKTQLSREPYELPTLILNPKVKSIFDFTEEDIEIVNYRHHDALKYNIAV